ncbi:unnamed protein product [Ectocarpus sp. 6 AP-2014]
MELSDDERIGLVGFLSEHVNKKQLEMVEHKAWNCLKDDADHKILKGIRKLVFVRMDSPESMSQSNFNTLINRRLGIPPGQQQQQGGSANAANSSTPNHAGRASGGGGGSRGGPAQGANHSGAVNGSPNHASGGSGGGGGSGSGQGSAQGASRVGASNGSPSPAGGGSRSRGGDSAQAPIHVSAVELEDTDDEEEGDTVSEHDQNDDNGGDSDGGDTDLEDTPAAKYEEHKYGFLQRRRWKVKEFEPPGEPPGNGYWVDASSEDDGIVLFRMAKPGDLERAKPRPAPTYITNNPYCTDAPKAAYVKRLTMYGLLKVVGVSSQGGIWRAPDAEIERVLKKDPRVPSDMFGMSGDAYVKVMGEAFRRHQEERDEIQREAEEESEDEVAAPQGKRSRVDFNS